ncbi:MAG: flagellar biosynthesis anti-sigma factor FlgM [Myxococcales bacterium]|nr:flagellar biosynthesis anti-sigma factor FlgM [Myxococcales bacterium]
MDKPKRGGCGPPRVVGIEEARKKRAVDRGELARIYDIATRTPECDEQKVLSIKQRLKAGGYRVPTETIAERILVDNLLEAFYIAEVAS